jgi:hypothetical protein
MWRRSRSECSKRQRKTILIFWGPNPQMEGCKLE